MLCEFVGFTTLWVTLVDVVLYVRDEFRVHVVHDGDTASSDLVIHSGKTTENDVIEHEQSVLMDPVPRRIEVAGFENVKDQLDTIDIDVNVAVLAAIASSLYWSCSQ